MKRNQNLVGCLIVGGIFFVLGCLALVMFRLYFSKSNFAREAVSQAQSVAISQTQGSEIRIAKEELRNYKPDVSEEDLPIEQFIAILYADGATTVAKDHFRSAINGRRVSWEFALGDIKMDDGVYEAGLSRSYLIFEGHGGSGSRVRFTARFRESDNEKLLDLRQGDIITVSGVLRIGDNNNGFLGDAFLVDESS